MTLAYAVQLDPYFIVLEPDARRYTRIFDSRQLVIVDDSETELEVRRALRGIGGTPPFHDENAR